MLHLPRHNGFLNRMLFEEGDHLVQLSDPDPNNVLGDLIDKRIGLFLDRDNRQGHSLFPCAFDHEERKFAVTGDEAVVHLRDSLAKVRISAFSATPLRFSAWNKSVHAETAEQSLRAQRNQFMVSRGKVLKTHP